MHFVRKIKQFSTARPRKLAAGRGGQLTTAKYGFIAAISWLFKDPNELNESSNAAVDAAQRLSGD
jgi:hypothetical protein